MYFWINYDIIQKIFYIFGKKRIFLFKQHLKKHYEGGGRKCLHDLFGP